jgi:hypothetical protein
MATKVYEAQRALNQIEADRQARALEGTSDTARLPKLVPLTEDSAPSDQLPAFLRRQAE